jgi:CHAT domain-containing protein/tetratricopeptide (TPR) repeat protein
MHPIKTTYFFLILSASTIPTFAQRLLNSDTLLAYKYYERARYLLNTHSKKSDDSICYYLEASSNLYEKNKNKNGTLRSLCTQIEFATKVMNEKKVLDLYHKIASIDKNENIFNANAAYFCGLLYYNSSSLDSALKYFLYSKESYIRLSGKRNLALARSYKMIGNILREKSDFSKALEYYLKALSIRKELLGDTSKLVAEIYNNIGLVYWNRSEFDEALEYFNKDLAITQRISEGEDEDIAASYNNIGNVYWDKAEYDKSLIYHLKSLAIKLRIFGEKNLDVAKSYANIGNVYGDMAENDKAMEYYFKSLGIYKELVGEKNPEVALTYNNIGVICEENSDFESAMKYYHQSLEIRKEILGDKNMDVAQCYNNIGIVYEDKLEYDTALTYFMKDFEISEELLGPKSIEIAETYANIGRVFAEEKSFNLSIDYFNRSLRIFKELVGEKHSFIANVYNRMGLAYLENHEYSKALQNFQYAIYANVLNFNDSADILINPKIKSILDYKQLLQSIQFKALIFEKTGNNPNLLKSTVQLAKFTAPDYYRKALDAYKVCDTLINLERKKVSKTTDKINLGRNASQIYQGAIDLCLKLSDSRHSSIKDHYSSQAFYFSEQNKNIVLFEAIASAEGMKFAGIPDSLLQKEHLLKTSISSFEKKLAEENDKASETYFRNQLFMNNRQYEELVAKLEKEYPRYYNLKYKDSYLSIDDIRKILDQNTALRGYLIGDTNIYIYTLTKENLEFQKVKKMNHLDDTIEIFRDVLTNTGEDAKQIYLESGYSLYRQLFPELCSTTEPHKHLLQTETVKHIIIIPDGSLGLIPFEALLYSKYNSSAETYQKLDYLIKRFSFSYSYSANLFYHSFARPDKSNIELKNYNDWIALAPIFDNDSNRKGTLRTRELNVKLNKLQKRSFTGRAALFNGESVPALPGTENEVKEIFNEYQNHHLNAMVLLHEDANEQFIKSGGLENFRILHFASHGFVNSEQPELSGILLSQDTTGGQDGILYSGEIYNLNLNADLTVLSACETGLGKVLRGEGIIGLTRALLYAGTKNIIVSLWQVSDLSTSELMYDFYNYLLNNKGKITYSECLYKAKLKMIQTRSYSHPFFWSPFILIGN